MDEPIKGYSNGYVVSRLHTISWYKFPDIQLILNKYNLLLVILHKKIPDLVRSGMYKF